VLSAADAVVQLADSRTRLRDWLTSLSMLYALPALVTHGYDDSDLIAAVGLSEADIDNLGLTAPGHRRKLLHLYNIDRFTAPRRPPVASPAPVPAAGAADAPASEELAEEEEAEEEEGEEEEDEEEEAEEEEED